MAETIGAVVVKMRGDTQHLTKSFDKATREVKGFGANVAKVGAGVRSVGASMITRFTLPIVVGLGAATAAYGGYDKAMTESLAIFSDVNEGVRAQMDQTVASLTRQSKQGATDLAKSYFFLGSAGLNAQQSMAALPIVAKFATAGAFDMASATDLLTDAQSALGMTVQDTTQNMLNMAKIGDLLVKANTLANASVQQFSEALTSEAASAMRQYGIELADGVAVLASYADQGLKGAHAGTTFSRAIRLLNTAVLKNSGAFKKYGVQVYNTDGSMRSMVQVIGDLSASLGVLSTREKVAALDALGFKARTQQAILPILGMTKQVQRYRYALRRAGGTMDTVANKQMKAFSNQMVVLRNRIGLVMKAIGETVAPVVLALARGVTWLFEGFLKLPKIIQKVTVWLAIFVAAAGPILVIIGTLMALLPVIMTGFAAMWAAVTKFAVAALPLMKGLALAMGKFVLVGLLAIIIWKAIRTAIAMAIGDGTTAMERYNDGIAKTNDKLAEFKRLAKDAYGYAAIQADYMWQRFMTVNQAVVDNVVRFFLQLTTNAKEAYFWLSDNWGNLFSAMWSTTKEFVSNVGTLFKELGVAFWDFIKNPTQGFNMDKVKQAASDAAGVFKGTFEGIEPPDFTQFEYRDILGEVNKLKEARDKAIGDLMLERINGPAKAAAQAAAKAASNTIQNSFESIDKKLAGALEKGTAEAFSAEMGGDKIVTRNERNTREIAQGTKQNGRILGQMLDRLGEGNTVMEIPA